MHFNVPRSWCETFHHLVALRSVYIDSTSSLVFARTHFVFWRDFWQLCLWCIVGCSIHTYSLHFFCCIPHVHVGRFSFSPAVLSHFLMLFSEGSYVTAWEETWTLWYHLCTQRCLLSLQATPMALGSYIEKDFKWYVFWTTYIELIYCKTLLFV